MSLALALIGGCSWWPTYNRATLKAIKVEADTLEATHPVTSSEDAVGIPKKQWPPVIASLHPEFVTVHRWGVDITTKPYFDGGWGYHVARKKGDLPMPDECYSERYKGVFWHGPC